MKLIMVEGIPGSGKSTTARFIQLQLERNGMETMLFHESAFEHPILLDRDIGNFVDWKDAYISNWHQFLTLHANEDFVFVMESVLFQSPIIRLLHWDLTKEEIISFIEELYTLLQQIDCNLIYLYQNEPSIGIHRMITARGGENWLKHTYERYKHEPYYLNRGQLGDRVHFEFLREYAEIASIAYSKYGQNTLAIDNTNWEWSLDYGKILEYLSLTYIPDPVLSVQEMERFVGVYGNKEMGLQIQVELKNHELYVFGEHRLKPRSLDKFYLDNISMTFEFLKGDNGNFTSLIISEKDIVGNRNEEGTLFVRT
ncbi:hypothetical protein GE107_10690 [Cohnella sp. CFH 77786]|uniref:hypothetical protein n=1 Tax=Cohnella sp. CFH 77786 TaxID=2662265 RepID=UPI001C60B302|nr:hypothetical protein [Cohnella sp. CFH 77786]MBW5446525.1 hypothetical protein [Cohnella sp. CFH 77786]